MNSIHILNDRFKVKSKEIQKLTDWKKKLLINGIGLAMWLPLYIKSDKRQDFKRS